MKLVRQEMDLQKKEETKLAKIKNKNPVVPTFYNLVKVNPVHINVSYQTDNILTVIFFKISASFRNGSSTGDF